jgi:hypothetical protein
LRRLTHGESNDKDDHAPNCREKAGRKEDDDAKDDSGEEACSSGRCT